MYSKISGAKWKRTCKCQNAGGSKIKRTQNIKNFQDRSRTKQIIPAQSYLKLFKSKLDKTKQKSLQVWCHSQLYILKRAKEVLMDVPDLIIWPSLILPVMRKKRVWRIYQPRLDRAWSDQLASPLYLLSCFSAKEDYLKKYDMRTIKPSLSC